MSNIETAIEEMIQTYIDEQDYVTGMTAEMYTDGEINDLRADMEGELGELQSRIEALEEKLSPAMVNIEELQSSIDSLERIVALVTGVSPTSQALEEKAAPAAEEQEPRAVNQIDWILGERAGSISIFAGYPTIDMLEQFVRSNLGTEEESKTMMIIMMTLATARNLINEKLEAES
jgi:archaellum component FlaC